MYHFNLSLTSQLSYSRYFYIFISFSFIKRGEKGAQASPQRQTPCPIKPKAIKETWNFTKDYSDVDFTQADIQEAVVDTMQELMLIK